MYWIYFAIFIIAIFTPEIIKKDFSWIQEEKAEQLALLALGVAAFIIFIIKEKQLGFQLKSKKLIQKEASFAAKDLANTYSYIGEINRKMDIFKDVALGLSDGADLSAKKETELYRSIINAVRVFTKSNHVSLRFINIENNNVVREIVSGKKAQCASVGPLMIKENKTFLEIDNTFFIRSPKPINNIIACISIEKMAKHQKIEDPDLIQALAAQALLLYNVVQNK